MLVLVDSPAISFHRCRGMLTSASAGSLLSCPTTAGVRAVRRTETEARLIFVVPKVGSSIISEIG